MLWLTEDQCSRSSNDVRFRPVADMRKRHEMNRKVALERENAQARPVSLPLVRDSLAVPVFASPQGFVAPNFRAGQGAPAVSAAKAACNLDAKREPGNSILLGLRQRLAVGSAGGCWVGKLHSVILPVADRTYGK